MFDSIGSTADEIAATLKASGIKGVPNTVAALNPIVRYVLMHVKVDAMIVDVIRGTHLTMTFRDWQKTDIPLPDAVRDFLARFNRGEYPELLMTSG